MKALSINAGMNQDIANLDDGEFEPSNQFTDEQILENALETLDEELKRLQATHQEHQNELQKMDELLADQVRISQTLTSQEDEVLTEFNSLEVEARVFQDIHRHLTHQCHAAEREKFYLSRIQLHSALFYIDVSVIICSHHLMKTTLLLLMTAVDPASFCPSLSVMRLLKTESIKLLSIPENSVIS